MNSEISSKRTAVTFFLNVANKLLFLVPALTFLLIQRLRFQKVQVVLIVIQAIGHMLSDFEIALSRKEPGVCLIVVPIGTPANREIFSIYRKNVRVVPRYLRASVVTILNRVKLFRSWKADNSISSFDHEVRSRAPLLLGLSQTGGKLEMQEVKSIGIDVNSPIVAICVRDDSSIPELTFRNSDINEFSQAIKFLVAKGFQVIRMGRLSETEIKNKIDGFYDYSRGSIKSDRLDLCIFEHVDFVISTGTGVDDIAIAFRKPVLYLNCLPVLVPNKSSLLKITLPKVLFKDSNAVNFLELCKMGALSLGTTSEYSRAGIEFCSNQEEVLKLVVEGYLNGTEAINSLRFANWTSISSYWPNLSAL